MKNFITEQYWCVKHIHIFRDLAKPDAHALTRITTFKDLKHEERICEEGVYLIKEGRVKISENLPDANLKKVEKRAANSDIGENQETKEVLEQGEIFGVIPEKGSILDGNLSTFAETLTEVCVGVVTIRDFSFFVKRKPHLALPLQRRTQFGIPNVLRTANNPFSGTYQKKGNWQYSTHDILKRSAVPDSKRTNLLSNIAFRSASSRLALLLQNLALVADRKGVVFLPRLSTKRISKLIGSSTETIETLLKTFQQHNVIDKRRGRIQILNAWQLKKIADARMKTLSPPQVPDTTANDIDFEMFANLQNEEKSETISTASSA